MRSNFSIVEKNFEHKLVYIRDNSNGGMTVTNDAENVLAYFQKTLGLDWTVIYLDTENQWIQIVPNHKTWLGHGGVGYKPWEGLDWYLLSKV